MTSNPNQHQIVNMDSCLERISYAILFHQKDYSFDYIISNFFPNDPDEDQIKSALVNDNRFSIHETEDGIYVRRNQSTVSPMELRVQQGVEQWKDQMSSYFREYNTDVKLCMLSQIVKRPKDVPKHVKLIDILNSDLQRRFLLITSSSNTNSSNKGSDDVVVKYKHTPTEVEYYHEQWRQNVITFLLKQTVAIPLVTIGTHVTKPKNLGKNQKLIDIIKLDSNPQKRFQINVDPSHNSLTRLCLAPEYCCELWRRQIYDLWRAACTPSRTARLMDLDFTRAPRPAPLSGGRNQQQYSLRDAILLDPQQRFCHAPDYFQLQSFQHQQLQHHSGGYGRQREQRQQQQRPQRQQPQRQAPMPGLSPHPYDRNVHTPHPGTLRHDALQRRQPHGLVHGQNQPSYRSQGQGQAQASAPPSMMNLSPQLAHNSPPGMPPPPPGFKPPHTQAPASVSTNLLPSASPRTGHFASSNISPAQSFDIDDTAPLPLEKRVSVEFSDYCTPPNFLDFLNDATSSGSSSGQSGTASLLPKVVLEKTVSSEFHEQEYTAIPGLLRFLSDAF